LKPKVTTPSETQAKKPKLEGTESNLQTSTGEEPKVDQSKKKNRQKKKMKKKIYRKIYLKFHRL